MAAEKQKCMILGAVPVEDELLFLQYDPQEYFVICADGGWDTAQQYHITPDLVVGDFDSAVQKPGKGVKVLTLPVEKDVTDTLYAVQKGLARGFRDFLLVGCLGGPRFDHTLASLETLEYLMDHGARGVLVDEHTAVFLLRDRVLRLTGEKGATVSVFPYRGTSCTVSYSGLKYPMNREDLVCGVPEPMGVSNLVIADQADIRVHLGTAVVVLYRE